MTQLELDFGEEFAAPQKVSRLRNMAVDLAFEAGLTPELEPWNKGYLRGHITDLEKYTQLVIEECAKVAENRFLDKASCTAEETYELQKKSIAADIRAMGGL